MEIFRELPSVLGITARSDCVHFYGLLIFESDISRRPGPCR